MMVRRVIRRIILPLTSTYDNPSKKEKTIEQSDLDKAICYVCCEELTTKPVSHSGGVPTIRTQKHAAHKLAKTLDIPIEKHFCDVGISTNRLLQPNFIKMLECLESYRQVSGKNCFVIIYDQSCVTSSNDEYGAITKAIVDAGGEIVLSGLIYEGERAESLTVQ